LALDAKDASRLGPGRDLELAPPLEGGDLDLAPQCRLRERDRRRADHIVPGPLEERVRGHRHGELEVARRAVRAGHVASTLDGARRTMLDAGGKGHRDGPRCRQEAGASALVAGVRDELAGPVAARAGSVDRDREDALLKTNAPTPHAGGAGLAGMSRFRSRT